MVIDKERVSKLVNSLVYKHEIASYREIASWYSPVVKAGTLCRIVKSKGKWLPKDKKILVALGVLEKVTMPQWMKTWRHLPTSERHKVIQEYLKWKERNNGA